MSIRRMLRKLGLLALVLAPAQVHAGFLNWGCCCDQQKICCPKYVHCTPQPPCLKFRCVCGKPICDICSLESYGYYPTCWASAYPPLNYNHCPTPPPASFFPTNLGHAPLPTANADLLPAPQPLPRAPTPAIDR